MRFPTRAQEWLADRMRWVQYPEPRRVVSRRGISWKHQMPLTVRIFVALLSITVIIVFGLLSILIGMFLVALLTS
jgi:hypothetical protein